MYKKRKRNKRYLLSILIIFILLGFIYFFANKHNNYGYIEKWFKGIIVKIENFIIPNVVVNYDNVISGINNELQNENNDLKEMLELEKSNYSFIHAKVVERNINWYQEIKINKGSNNGIKTDMAVVSNNGLIGKITKVGDNFSIVKLLSSNSNDMKVSVNIVNDTESYHGILNGYNVDDGTLLIINVPKESKITIDDLVYTSGLGGVYPAGIYIGKVVDITYDQFGLEKNIKVRKDSSYDTLRYVSIITNEGNIQE